MKKKPAAPRGTREKRVRMSPDILWGLHPVYEALEKEPERVSEIIMVRDKRGGKWDELIENVRKRGIKLHFVDSLKLSGEGAAQVRHQGVICRVSSVPMLPFGELLERFRSKVEQGQRPRLMICDSIQDPHNLGAIVRSALASGMEGVVITSENSAPLSGTAAKSSAGAVSHMDISHVTNLSNALEQLKKAGAWVFGAVKDSEAVSIYSTDFRVPSCIVVGSEGRGIRPLVKKHCDVLVSIPMKGTLDSLNSSVAAAVIMFEALRQNSEE